MLPFPIWQSKDEVEIDAMLRISRMSEAEIEKVRARLRALRGDLNKRSFGMLEGLWGKACKGD